MDKTMFVYLHVCMCVCEFYNWSVDGGLFFLLILGWSDA